MTTVKSTDILRLIRDIDAHAEVTVEQTGGGCGTIYIGKPNDENRYAVVIGPGAFYDDEYDLEDLFVGPDDDGDSDTDGPFTQLSTLQAAIRRAMARACEV